MKKIILFLIFIPILFLLALVLLYANLSQAPSKDSAPQSFVVNQGDSVKSIASRLKSNRFIKSEYLFILESYRLGLSKKLQAGSFELSSSLNLSQVIDRLSKAGSFDYWFTIIDGQRLEEFAPDKEFEILARDYEGQLLPDKYLVPQSYTNQQLIDYIHSHFTQKYPDITKETLILASLIEREARTLQSKKMVSGILKNRLEIGMPLQLDASVQYARDSQFPALEKYWLPLDPKDLKIVSPFNTYLNPGLPPSPICNPGSDSIQAALNPTPSDYLYYITGNDNLMHYAKTLEEHNRNIRDFL